jgi:hypothetical protein
MPTTFSRLLPILTLGACYTYQPLSAPEPEVGTRVSVQLTDDGSRELWGRIGPNVLHVEGDVVGADSAVLDLSVRQVENQRGIQSDWKGEQVMVPRRLIAGVQQRRLSVGGTGLLGGLAVVTMYALYRALGGGGLFEGNSGTGNSPPQQ